MLESTNFSPSEKLLLEIYFYTVGYLLACENTQKLRFHQNVTYDVLSRYNSIEKFSARRARDAFWWKWSYGVFFQDWKIADFLWKYKFRKTSERRDAAVFPRSEIPSCKLLSARRAHLTHLSARRARWIIKNYDPTLKIIQEADTCLSSLHVKYFSLSLILTLFLRFCVFVLPNKRRKVRQITDFDGSQNCNKCFATLFLHWTRFDHYIAIHKSFV